jgi:hypothetical protein
LQIALSLVPKEGPGKIFLLSDGRWTGRDPAQVASWAATRGVAIDFRPLQRIATNDLAVARLDAPASVAPGESFLLTAWVHSPIAQTVAFELRRGPQVLASGNRNLTAGLNRLTFRDQAGEPGNQGYSLSITGSANDPVPENNTARVLVGIEGPRPILHVTRSPKSGLARLLKDGGLNIKVQAPEQCVWSLEELSRYSAVVLENLPADKVGERGMQTLGAWVKETGAGLMITGGRDSYAPGGYYHSPLEPIMPVSMELRNEHRKLALAVVVALDRSGSMAIPVGGGRGSRPKMDLANLGTVEVLNLLGPMDEFGVLAVDTVAHTIAEFGPVKDKGPIKDKILRINSEGGGIFIYEALAAASQMIVNARAGTKHIILFADAMDSEEPGRYQELLAKCQEAGVTVSVIGLGTEKDKDADLLRDIAKRGKGRIFFTDNPEELPRLFAQDTFVIARNTFLDEPTPIEPTPGLAALTGRSGALARSIGGYNLCYLRPEATLATITLDEYKAPVVAAWQAGIGRVLCYTGEADGQYAGEMARWKGVGDFFTSLARWTSGQSGPLTDNMLLTQEVRNGVNVVQLHLDPDRKADAFSAAPRVTILRSHPGGAPDIQKTTLHWTGADTLAIDISMQGAEVALTTVEIPGQKPVALPPVCLPYSPEFKPIENDQGLSSMEHLARATGGKERLELANIWLEIPRASRMLSIAHWLLLAALCLLLLEVLERRTGLLSRQGRWALQHARIPGKARIEPRPREIPKRTETPAPIRPAVVIAPRKEVPIEAPPEPAAPAPAPANEGGGMLDALRKARQRTRGRMD